MAILLSILPVLSVLDTVPCHFQRYYTCALASCSVVYCNRSCLWVCVFVCVGRSVTMIARNCEHRSSANWVCRWSPVLKYSPDLFWSNFTTVILAVVKDPHDGFSNIPKIHRLVDLRLNKLKAALAEVCTVWVLLVKHKINPSTVTFCGLQNTKSGFTVMTMFENM